MPPGHSQDLAPCPVTTKVGAAGGGSIHTGEGTTLMLKPQSFSGEGGDKEVTLQLQQLSFAWI